MKPMVKVLLGVVAGALVLAVAAPPAEAQCGAGARGFASIGGAGTENKFRLNPGLSNGVLGQEFGRFWLCSNSNEGNNFIRTALRAEQQYQQKVADARAKGEPIPERPRPRNTGNGIGIFAPPSESEAVEISTVE